MSYAGGVAVHGGAQANFVHTTIAYNEVALNGAQFSGLLCSGGGILSGGTVVLNASSVLSNTVYASSESPCGTIGGGIDNEGSLLITESTVAYNISHDAFYSPTVPGWAFAGGIYNASSATLRVENSTISRNLTRQDHAGPPLANGGGLLNYGQATMNNVTIAENSAESPSADAYGGGVNVASGWLALGNTIIAGNHVAGDVPEHGPDCLFTLSSQDYNLIGITAGCTITGTVAHNLYDLDARLGPLQDNGGPTWTHGLLAGSPAIHHGDNGTCAPVDQRGIARPQGCVCDIGAFEVVMPWLWFNPIFAQAPVVP
jgi:adhesin HecA-like repeat protein